MTRTITSKQTIAFWKYMSKKYGTTAVPKAGAVEMQGAATMLALMGIMDAKKFLSKYTTTLGDRIYVPFEIGNAANCPLVDQVAICVHEHVHVQQFSSINFIWDYCLDSSKRATHECRAYVASMEMVYFFTGKCPSPTRIAKQLVAYNCTMDDVEYATKFLTTTAHIIRRGGVVTPESKVAISWFGKLSRTRVRT